MARAKLDRIDRRILSDLQSNGRMTNVELAERAGISAPPCLRRVRALERAGIIKGYHAELSPEALGYSVSVFALVGLNSQAECATPLERNLRLARQLGVNGTPTIFYADGTRTTGYVPGAEVERRIAAAAASRAPVANAQAITQEKAP